MFLFYGYSITSISITKCMDKIILLIIFFFVILKPRIILYLYLAVALINRLVNRVHHIFYVFFSSLSVQKKKKKNRHDIILYTIAMNYQRTGNVYHQRWDQVYYIIIV